MRLLHTGVAFAALAFASTADAAPVRYVFESSRISFSLVAPDFVTEFTPPVDFEPDEMESCVAADFQGEKGTCDTVSFTSGMFGGANEVVTRVIYETIASISGSSFEGGTFSQFGVFTDLLGTSTLTISAADEAPVPEPGAMLLIGLGMAGLIARRRLSTR